MSNGIGDFGIFYLLLLLDRQGGLLGLYPKSIGEVSSGSGVVWCDVELEATCGVMVVVKRHWGLLFLSRIHFGAAVGV